MYSWKDRDTVLPSAYLLLAAFALSLLVCMLEQTNRTISEELQLVAWMVTLTAPGIVALWAIARSPRTTLALAALGVTVLMGVVFTATIGTLSLIQCLQQTLVNFNNNAPTADMIMLWTWLVIASLMALLWITDYICWRGWPQAFIRGSVDTSLAIIAEGRSAYRTPQRIQEGESS